MKKWKNLGNLLPAAAVAAFAIAGFSMSTPVLEEIVWPEKPVITDVQAQTEEAAQTENSKEKEEKDKESEEVQAVGDYEDGTYTGEGTGYSGTTKVEVVVKDGQITAVNILNYVDDDTFFNRAKGVIDNILLKQTWEVDSVSGATYSSRGILEAVKNALTGSTEKSATAASASSGGGSISTSSYDDSQTWQDGTYSGSAKGFGGTISVNVTIKDGKIKAINVTSHSGETDAYYNKAKSVISSILSSQSPNVDTVSGATYSSNGIREAVKAALTKAAKGDTSKAKTTKTTKKKKSTTTKKVTLPEGSPADGTYTGEALCSRFGYKVQLTAVFKDGKLTKLKGFTLVDNEDEANIAFADKAWVSLKKALLKDQTAATADVVSGATYSSNTILAAYKDAYNQAVKAGGGKAEEEEKEEENTPTIPNKTTGVVNPNNPAGTETTDIADGSPADGTYATSAWVDIFDYQVLFDVTFEDGKVKSLDHFDLANNEDDGNGFYADKAWAGMKEEFLAGETTEADTVSHATYTSSAIKEAFLKAYQEAVAKASGNKDSEEEKDPEDSEDTKQEQNPEESKDPDDSSKSDKKDDSQPSESDTPSVDEETGSSEEDAEKETTERTYSVYKDGTYTVSASCVPDEWEDFDTYTLTAQVTFSGDKVVSITGVTGSNTGNKSWYNQAAKGMVSKMIAAQSGNVDTVSGATCSSLALIEIYSKACEEAKAACKAEE